MTEHFNQIEKNEQTSDAEALQKIRGIKNRDDFSFIGKQLFYDLKQELFGPVREKFHKKYPAINWDTVTDKEFPKDYAQALEETQKNFYEAIRNKSEVEILDRAKEIYQFNMDNENFTHAYEIANDFLNQESVQEAGGKAIENVCQKMRLSKNEEEKTEAANLLLSSSFVPKIERSDEIIKDVLLTLIQSEQAQKETNNVYLRIKQKFLLNNWRLPQDNTIFNFIHPLAKAEVESLVKRDKDRGLKLAQSFEKIGFLDLEVDGGLFENLTQ